MSADPMDEIVAASLRQRSAKVECNVTWQDGNVSQYNLHASTIRRAKREISASLRKKGLRPVDRWSVVESDGREFVRRFSRGGAGDKWNFPIVR
jgi:hypothetical protein